MNQFSSASACLAQRLLTLAQCDGLRAWSFKGKALLPVVQGGMGVGVSAGSLAGTVAGLGAMGTISAVDLRRLHPDLMAQTARLDKDPDARERIDKANLVALEREIAHARTLAQGRGMLAVNVMRALSAYEAYVMQALQSGVDAVVVGAGLPLDLPELAKDFPETALIPILSDARGVQLLIRKWEKKGRLPDAIVMEHPRLAGGHLGAAKLTDLGDARFEFETAVPDVLQFLHGAGLQGQIPLVLAGGIWQREDIVRLQALGASAVQLGTAFAVTEECDADPGFKHVLAQARAEDIVTFMSVAGLPARAVKTPWLEKYLRIEPVLQAAAHVKKKCNMSFDCLVQCGLRDGKGDIGQFCIDQQLGHAMRGDYSRGLYFRGAGRLPFGSEIRPVHHLLHWLLAGIDPVQPIQPQAA